MIQLRKREIELKNLAIIPARSGSKGLPDKNIKLLNGKPLIAYTIEAAQKSKLFDEILVSTDSKVYADIAIQYGVNVPFLRSDELAGDKSSSWDVVKEVINQYEALGQKFDRVALLQPTSPLRQPEDIVKGFDLMREKKADFVVSVCEVEHSPLWSNTLPIDNSMDNFFDQSLIHSPRQDLPTYYRLNGALYIVMVDHLLNTTDLYSQKSYALVMNKQNSVDIDDSLDFTFAELLMKNRSNK